MFQEIIKEYSKVRYDPKNNLFYVTKINGEYITKGPLNVGFQVTRKCNLKCIYCSESPPLKDMGLNEISIAFKNLKLAGVKLIKLTGGEALMRRNIKEIIECAKSFGFYVAMDSNATLITDEMAEFLASKLVYLESTIDGRQETHNKVRGKYNEVIAGIKRVAERGLPVYIAMVLLGDSLEDAKHVLNVAHTLNARFVKFLTPIPKARGKTLPSDYLDNPRLEKIWKELCKYKRDNKLKPTITLSDWKRIGRVSIILIHPDGMAIGSPSIGEEACITPLGNVLTQPMTELWKGYPHKLNHILKYTFETMLIEQ